jgi:hypothetical protein
MPLHGPQPRKDLRNRRPRRQIAGYHKNSQTAAGSLASGGLRLDSGKNFNAVSDFDKFLSAPEQSEKPLELIERLEIGTLPEVPPL